MIFCIEARIFAESSENSANFPANQVSELSHFALNFESA